VVDIWKSPYGKKNIVRVFEQVQWVLRIYGHKREQIAGEWRKNCIKKRYIVCILSHILLN
jgi:hypothetical protein